MGIWKTDNSTHTNIFVSKEAAKEQRKAEEEKRKAAQAIESQAYEQRRMVEIEAEKEIKMAEMRLNAERASNYREIAQEGTADAFRQLFKAYSTEQQNEVNNRKSLKSQFTGKKDGFDNFEDVKQALDSFPYAKVPGELEKIFVFLVQTCKKESMGFNNLAISQLENLETVAEMNSRNPEIAALLPTIKATISEIKQKRKVMQKKVFKIIGFIFLAVFILIVVLAIFSSMS